MKVIKRFWAPIFIVCFLLLGYVIGQVRNSVKAGQELETEASDVNKESLESNKEVDSSNDDLNATDFAENGEWNGYRLVFEDANETADNPWGFTAGVIEIDEEKCILLTPNTSVIVYPEETGVLGTLDAYIHPWVSGLSDGAGLVIWYLDGNDEIVGQEEVAVGADGENAELSLGLTRFNGTDHFKVLCNNGGTDDSGDWVVLKMHF